MAGSQSMSFDSIGGIAGDRRADTLQLLRGSCFIHQCARIFAQDPIAVPEHMQGHEHCDACVQHRDPGQHGEDDADEDTKRGDHIGQHVLAIRNKGGRPLQTTLPDDQHAPAGVENRGDHADGQTGPRRVDRPGCQKPAIGFVQDCQRGGDDQRADDDRRHIFRLVVAVRMFCVGRAGRYPDRDDGRDRRRHVDDAFQGIGIESQAAGNEIGELDGQHYKADPPGCRAQFSEIYPLQNFSDRRRPLIGRAGEMIE